MDERNEEKLEEKKEQRKIIESYDGDPDDLVFFQTEQDFAEQAKQKQAESIISDAEDVAQKRKDPYSRKKIRDSRQECRTVRRLSEKCRAVRSLPEKSRIVRQ